MPDYYVLDFIAGRPAADLAAFLNVAGAEGWRIRNIDMMRQNERRVIFVKGEAMTEYLVVDYDTGLPAAQLEADLDGYGASGWELVHVDTLQQAKRRGVLMKVSDGAPGAGGGGIPEAPEDDITYGRRNTVWTPALALSNDVLDGGNF